jgi:hypothetical protein
MSWHYSQALVEEYLGENSLDGELSVPSNGTPTHGMFWSPDKTTAASTRSRSGMTFRPSTGSHGADLLTWYLAGSRAKTSAQPEKEPESKASEAVCGLKCLGSLARFDLDSRSWKTHQFSLLGDLEPFSETWPRWGMMRGGECWELSMPVLRTSEKESGSLPTPRATDGTKGSRTAEGAQKEWARGRNKDLGMVAAMWPTPRACMTGAATPERLNDKNRNLEKAVAQTMWPTPQAHKTTESGEIVNADGTPWDGIRKPHSKTTGRPITTALADAVKFATPQARDFRTGQQSRWENPERTRNLNDQIGGQLNPTWVEWLMGWPLGWTDCAASAMDKCRQWCASHGKHSTH